MWCKQVLHDKRFDDEEDVSDDERERQKMEKEAVKKQKEFKVRSPSLAMRRLENDVWKCVGRRGRRST